MSSLIKNVAIIMDGNGRWAKRRFRPRIWGHVRGSSIVSNIVEEADSLGIESLTLYAFSTENWSRPESEVLNLFKLLKKFLQKEKKRIMTNKIRFKVIGHAHNLPHETLSLLNELEEMSAGHTGLKLTFAFGYGGRDELICGFNRFIKENPGKQLEENDFPKYLFNADVPEIDLLIRTGGDSRISNFLLWQIAYAELFFTSTMWPDFTRKEFRDIIEDVSKRERRFGQVCAVESLSVSQREAGTNQESIRTGGNSE